MGNSGNSNFDRARKAKEDEFYTQLSDIENELKHYRKHFKGKTVLCNCDDPYESNFFKYFAMNFNKLGLKKLITTCYKESPIADTQLSLFDDPTTPEVEKPPAFKLEITQVDDFNGDGAINIYDVEWLIRNDTANVLTPLQGDGDFRSQECVKMLEEADIVVTNPPFSLFREYLSTLVESGKQFLIIGNQNAMTCKEVFPLLKSNQVWLGYKSGDMKFTVPDYYEPRETRFWIDENGQKWRSLGNICWYTNLDHKKRHETIDLFKKYSEKDYPTYENLDAIEVGKVDSIPENYAGLMGVPITFMSRYNPEQFEILGLSREMDLPTKTGMPQTFIDEYFSQGGTAQISAGHPDVCYYDNQGKAMVPYRRVIIRNLHPETEE